MVSCYDVIFVMDELIRKQLQDSRLEHPEFKFRVPTMARGTISRQILNMFSEHIHLLLVFLIIFLTLMIVANWKSFSVIADDLLGNVPVNQQIGIQQRYESPGGAHVMNVSDNDEDVNDADLGEAVLFPPDYRLEIPQLFEGTIPINTVNDEYVDFANFYDQAENIIQQKLQMGVVRYPFTADPGEHGNVFITGHSSNYSWAKGDFNAVFALLYKLKKGDEYSIYFGGKKYTYRVFAHFEVEPEDVSVLHQPLDRKMATLMTCTPVGTTLRRLIVQADLVRVED